MKTLLPDYSTPVESTPLDPRSRPVHTPRESRAGRPLFQWFAAIVGLALLLLGLGLNWKLSQTSGEDFAHLYVIGVSLDRGFDIYAATDLASVYRAIEGTDAYTPWGIFNSPSAGIAILPLTFLPLGVAKAVWYVMSCLALIVGVYQLLGLVAPRLSRAYRLLLVGAVMSASATRWGFLYLQGAPLMFGLLCLFLAALRKDRRLLALAIGGFVVCLKFTLGLPFLGLAFVRRQYWIVAGVVAIWILANGLGFVRVGGVEAVRGYQANMTHLEQADQLNYPDYRVPTSMQRLDWPYLINAVYLNLPVANALGVALSGLAVLWLFWEWRRSGFASDMETALAFFGPLVCLSLLSVYHHHYDAIALLGPAIVYVARSSRYDRRLVGLFVVPVILFAGLFEVGRAQDLVGATLGEAYVPLLKLLGVIAVNVAFVASLLLLRGYLRARAAVQLA